ncbi:hypothetical protein PTTG_01074 [Puccinia triticina 1-1 BBBD Race 1]|uniref:Uncharacterized protein n=2 Tax=Puccinia triticina TaxID=208348 RepID=A0A0C4EK01_PUCT1|nr:uncharacterized protein PtA15_10A668 [Puccinia triticina]OAV97778.1 hypothetical protein PTTG_01074 [Puccinia triticina 1-1 BBBD Race 1]WAQ89244.1 hypothetical protein PtA15_10A668 [Puccinia triticina]WAR59296.1 hypothetical protein PtB15_10B638 [Puccinia triticina]
MERSDPDGSPLARKRPATRKKFAKEVYKPSNRLLPPNKRLWASENANDVSEDTTSSKEIQKADELVPLKKGKGKVDGESEAKEKQKPGRKIANKLVKLSDKSNAQKELITRPSGRVTRSSAMTNTRVGRSKMSVLDEAADERRGAKVDGEDGGEEYDNFLDVSADHRIHPFTRSTKLPTQQSLGADVTLTFDTDRHARALADCSPIPRIGGHHAGSGSTSTVGVSKRPAKSDRSPPHPPARKTRAKLNAPPPQASTHQPSPPKKRVRRQAATKSSKPKASESPMSDDPLMI